MTTAAICATREVSWRPSFYRGEQYNSDLGLYYLRARYYNPATGRFMSRDPLDGDPTDPQSLHKYLYAGGDPVNRIDPSGRADSIETIFTITVIATPTEVALSALAGQATAAIGGWPRSRRPFQTTMRVPTVPRSWGPGTVNQEGTLNYTYYPTGKVQTITSSNANGASASYTYDDLSRISTVVDNRLSGNNATTYTYDPASNLATATYPNGVQSAMTYDSLNRITGLATQSTGYLYQRGPTGNLTSATESNGRTLNWSYDGIYRLANEAIASDPSQENGSVAYSLDPIGSRLSDTSSLSGINSGSYGYNANDEVSTETYDQNGNATQVGAKSFTYDAENHLTGMSASGTSVSIAYDAFGNRVSKNVNGVTTQYLVGDDVNPTGYPQVLNELTNGVVSARVFSSNRMRRNSGTLRAFDP
jgi:RHS repeat-associated protein